MTKNVYVILTALINNSYLSKLQEVPMSTNFKQLFDETYKQLGGMGERVLG